MSSKETLESMQILFGNDVACTNGLYHIYNKDHTEVYIDVSNKSIDKRCRYITIVVTDKVIVTNVIGINGLRAVILDKETLECLYKTNGKIQYLDKNMVYDVYNGRTTFISHTGRELYSDNNIQSIEILGNNKYLLKSRNSFSDNILVYRSQLDVVISIAKNKRYLIYKSKKQKDAVEVVSMQGGKYIYKFKTNECINTFTDKIESIQLFDMMG